MNYYVLSTINWTVLVKNELEKQLSGQTFDSQSLKFLPSDLL